MISPAWLPAVARAHAAQAACLQKEGLRITRVNGGANNALYRVEAGGEVYTCKLCVADERSRAWREYAALSVLQACGVNAAPQPILLDESQSTVPFPLVVYRWIEGEPLQAPLSEAQLAAFLEGTQRFHAIQPDEAPGCGVQDAWFHWFDFEPYLAEIDELLARYGGWLSGRPGEEAGLAGRLAELVAACKRRLRSPGLPSPRRPDIPLRLCRVDPNLRNVIWNGEKHMLWVDWEYSGWGDPALDLAELRWHAALEDLGQDAHDWLRASYAPPRQDPGFARRLAAWDIMLATRWPLIVLRLYWSAYNGPDRLRLTRPAEDPAGLRQRLARFIERAERHLEERENCSW